MTTRGKLIAIEGIDGSGKRTQLELLTLTLKARGHSVYSTGFPQYDSWFGKMVGKFLNGDLGPLESVDPHFSAMLYAGDRFEAKFKLEAALDSGQILLVDRYIASNLAHQTARVPPAKRSEFLQWIEHLEYQIYGLPRENLILYLRVPPRLEDAAEMYDSLSRSTPWATIQCFDATRDTMREPEEIAIEVLAAVEGVLASASAGEGR